MRQPNHRRRHHARRRFALAAVAPSLALSAAVSSTALAADISWIATGSANFNTPTNWDPAQVPTVADIAIFANNATGTAALTAPAAVNDLSFRNTSGSITLDTAGGTLSFNRFLVGTAAGHVNNVIFSGGTFQHTSTGQVFSIGNANGSNGNRLTITGSGVRVLSTATGTGSNLGIAGSNNNELHVTDQAFVDIRNNINVGVIGATPSAGNLININNATFQITNGNRGIFLRQGTLTVNNSYADFGGFIDADDPGNTAVVQLNSGTFFSRATRQTNGQPFRIGDGGVLPATYGMSYSGPTLVCPDGIVINSNGRLAGSGLITGNVSGVAGAKVNPSIIGQPPLSSDDRNFGTLSVSGNWDNTGIEITLDAGDFPTQVLNDVPPFDPPINILNINGTFTHGGSVLIDLATYVPPNDQSYEFRMLGFAAEVGTPASTPVSFINGSPLTFDWRPDGLYVQFPQVLGGSTWNFDGNGDWTNASNWTGGVPNAPDASATFGTVITAPATVTVDAPITVGEIEFNSPVAYTVAGPNAITLDVSAGTTASIRAAAGTHLISASLIANDPVNIDIDATADLSLTGGLTAAASTVTKVGGGRLTVGATTVDGLDVSAGQVRLQANGTAAGRAVVKSLAVDSGAGASLDVTNNAVVVDFDVTDPSSAVRSLLVSGYAGGAWTGPGINSSAVASAPGTSVGYALATDVTPAAIFGAVDATAVLVRYTVGGDANLDGITNIADFSRLASNFNLPGVWSGGDFNYDGTVGIADFSILAANFNQSVPAGGARPGAIPEPTAAALVIGALLGASAQRRQRRAAS